MTTNPSAARCTTPCIACMTDESHDPQPSTSPCRRTDQHDPHVYEVYSRPFQCPGRDKARTDAELLAELGPLAAVIADKIRTVPVRIGPGGADDLISELTIAVAVYVGREVLPADALALANPPYPAEDGWSVEVQRRSGTWVSSGPACRPHAEAVEDYERAVEMSGHRWPHRLLRAITTYAVEAEHTPERP